MSDIRYCEHHSFFQQSVCPSCGDEGDFVVDGSSIRTYSGFLSKLLRHTGPERGLTFSSDGWTDLKDVIDIFESEGYPGEQTIRGIVAMDDKGRYELQNEKIRAGYGHSIASIEITESGDVPDVLYHGTAPRFKESIMKNGLTPQSRNAVHLTSNRDEAIAVGKRHSKNENVVLFTVDTESLKKDYSISNPNGEVYTVSKVPPSFFTEMKVVGM